MEKKYLIIGYVLLLAVSTGFALAIGGGFSKPQQAYTSPGTGTVSNCQNYPYSYAIPQWYCNQINVAAATIWKEWFPVAAAAVLFSFFIATIIFIAGIILKNQKIREFGIGELYEALATTIIVVIFLFLSAVMFGIIPSITTGNIDPYTTALDYLGKNINATMALEKALFNTYLIDSYYTSISLVIKVGPYTLPNLALLFSVPILIDYLIPISSITSIILDALLLLYTEFYAILFFMYASIPVFLIPGILLRSIFPTRSVGGMMMAIAIGFYFLMPLLFSIAFYFTSASALSIINSQTQQIIADSQGTGIEQNAMGPTSSLVLMVHNLASSMGTYWLSLLFYPALIIAITYESIIEIAQFIGGAAKRTAMLRKV
ncbi:MAG: hypothetical protein ACP5T4_02650 [Candidatus Micrarchaeia archaeon]